MKIYCHNVRVWTRDRDKTSDWYWRKRMKRIRELIKEENPDVLCLQELSFPANLYIPREYRRVGFSASHHIYVKRRAFKVRRARFHFRWNKAEIKPVGGREWLNLICVHLHWNAAILERNMAQIDALAKKCEERGIPTIACGDFNNGRDKIAVLTDLHVMLDPMPTHHNPATGAVGWIDHFAVTPVYSLLTANLSVIRSNTALSDHNPLALTIE